MHKYSTEKNSILKKCTHLQLRKTKGFFNNTILSPNIGLKIECMPTSDISCLCSL